MAAMSAEKVYWRKKLPRGFQLFMENLARSIIRQQPEDILEYAAVYFERKMVERNAALRRLPDVSYLEKLKYKFNNKPTAESVLSTSKERAAVESIPTEEENKKAESAHTVPGRKSLKEQGGVRSDGAVALRDVSSPVHLQKTAGDDGGGRDTPTGVSEAVERTLQETREDLAYEASRLSATEHLDEQDDAHASHEKTMLVESEERIELKQDLLKEIRESSRSLHKTQTTQETPENISESKGKISAESVDSTEHRESERELAESVEQVVHAKELSRTSIETKRYSVAAVHKTEPELPKDVQQVVETFDSTTDKTNESMGKSGNVENIVEAGPVVPVEAGPVVPVVEAGPVVPVVEPGPVVPVAEPEPLQLTDTTGTDSLFNKTESTNIESQQQTEESSSKYQNLAEEHAPDVEMETVEVGDENQDEHLVETCAVTCSAEAVVDERDEENRDSESEPTKIEHDRETTEGQSKEVISSQDGEDQKQHTKGAASEIMKDIVDNSHEQHKEEDLGKIEKSEEGTEVQVEETNEQTDGLTQHAEGTDEHTEESAKQTEEDTQQAEGIDQHSGEPAQTEEETQQAEGIDQHSGEPAQTEEETQQAEGIDQHSGKPAKTEEETQQAEGTDQHPEESAQQTEEVMQQEEVTEEPTQTEKVMQQEEVTEEPTQTEEVTEQAEDRDERTEEPAQQIEEVTQQEENTNQHTVEPGEQDDTEEKDAINHSDASEENPSESHGTSESTQRKDSEIVEGTEEKVEQSEEASGNTGSADEVAQETVPANEEENTESGETVDSHKERPLDAVGADENVTPGSPAEDKQDESKQEDIPTGENTADVSVAD